MKRRVALVLALALAACGGHPAAPRDDGPEALRGLRAWARLYGVLRFWHPSDEAAAVDWDRVAVLGVQRVRGARDAAAIEAALAPIVAGVAPTVRFAGPGEALADAPEVAAGGDELVAWQYLGAGFDGGQPGVYAGKRTHRDQRVVDAAGWTAFSQTLDAAPFRGQPLRLRARLKAEAPGKAELWARVDRAAGVGFFQNTQDRPATGPSWTEVTIEGVVDADAVSLSVGGLAEGDGAAWFDDFHLEIGGVEVALTNPAFDDGTAGWGGRIAMPESGYGWAAQDGAVRVVADAEVVTADLFDGHAETGEVADLELGAGLRARVPIALWSRDGHTTPAADGAALADALAALPAPAVTDADARIADVIVAWATYGQFSPYFGDTGIDWDAALDRALVDALDDRTAADHHVTLDHLGAAMEDGHVFASVPEDPRDAALPVELGWIDAHLVVIATATVDAQVGEIVTALDGVPAKDALDAMIARTSGTDGWRREVALGRLTLGVAGETTVLEVNGMPLRLTYAADAAPQPQRPAAIAELEGDVWYVDLERSSMEEIDAVMDQLAAARGVIFDLRGYPNGTHPVLQHLLGAPEHDRWMHTPRWDHPALPGQLHQPASWDSVGWELEPLAPRITGEVVFLTGPGAISYAESVMGYVEALGLPIVGEGPTAGTNGNVRLVPLPTGASFYFTGMRVTRHDGRRSHLLGIAPTITVTPTLEQVRMGKDAVLDRAYALISRSEN